MYIPIVRARRAASIESYENYLRNKMKTKYDSNFKKSRMNIFFNQHLGDMGSRIR